MTTYTILVERWVGNALVGRFTQNVPIYVVQAILRQEIDLAIRQGAPYRFRITRIEQIWDKFEQAPKYLELYIEGVYSND